MTSLARILAASALVGFTVVPGASAFAEMVKYKADLQAKSEVPATDSSGSGTADITVDTEARDYVMALGYLQAPVVVAGSEHWSGFRPDRIKALGSVVAATA